MSNKHSRQKSNLEAKNLSGADDLKLINGISATLEQRLQRVGVQTYVQLAGLTPDETAKLLGNPDGLKERITKQNWIGQARELAESKDQKRPASKAQNSKMEAGDQTYEAFAVELMIGTEREVIHTRVMQISTGDEEIWGGWQEKRLADFFVKRADLFIKPIETPQIETAPVALAEPTVIPAPAELPTESSVDTSGVTDAQAQQSKAKDGTPHDQEAIKQSQMKTDQQNKLEILSQAGTPTRILQHGQPFRARLSLNLSDLALLETDTFTYTVTLTVHNLDGEKKTQTLGYKKGELHLSQPSALELNNLILPLGGYRLEAAVAINKPTASCCGFQLQISGGILQVY